METETPMWFLARQCLDFCGLCAYRRVEVSETCLKVFGFPPHKVEPKEAKSSVSTLKITILIIQILFNKENCSLITSLNAYRLLIILFVVNSGFRLPNADRGS